MTAYIRPSAGTQGLLLINYCLVLFMSPVPGPIIQHLLVYTISCVSIGKRQVRNK